MIDNRAHLLLSRPALGDIRKDFLSQFVNLSPALVNHMEVSNNFLICLLDPYSPRVPEDVRLSYEVSVTYATQCIPRGPNSTRN